MLLPSAKPGDKITISIRKGITWHIQNSTRVTSQNISIHGASLFGLSEFDGGGGTHLLFFFLSFPLIFWGS